MSVVHGEVLVDFIKVVDTSPFGGRITRVGCWAGGDLKIVEVAGLTWVNVCLDCLEDMTSSFRVKNAFDCCGNFVVALFGVMELATGEVNLLVENCLTFCFMESTFADLSIVEAWC